MKKIIFACLLLVIMAGCATQADAPDAVENYLKALVTKDREQFVKLFCADYEAAALIEFDSFGAVDAKLDGLACESAGTDGNATLVACQGQITVTYQGENNQILSLADNVYRVVQEGGEWKLCGYQ
ncbi:MAG TPA: hypothetical protein VHO69_14540 [Phototrophicaceae bacterium]|nr:hypothetical protein [Phototrophicaceae bacterium]